MTPRTRSIATTLAGAAFIAAIALANNTTAHYGFISVGFGLTATAGTYLAGFCLAARDALQDLAGRWAVLTAIAVGAALSVWTSNPALAVASGVAFAVSELTDAAVYTPIRRRARFGGRRWSTAVTISGLAGSVVDSILFLWIAGFPIRSALPGQLVGKAWPTLAFLALGVITATIVRRWTRALPDAADEVPASA